MTNNKNETEFESNTKAQTETEKTKPYFRYFLIASSVITLVVAIYALLLIFKPLLFSGFILDKSGLFGDSFGIITSWFSGLAFAGIIITIVMQKDELALTRNVLTEQKDEMAAQNTTMLLQRFENTFFHLLSLHHSTLNSISGEYYGNVSTGTDVFNYWHSRLCDDVHYDVDESSEDIEEMVTCFTAFYQDEERFLKPYLNNFTNLIKFVKNKGIEDKDFYNTLILSQLSKHELVILVYCCISRKTDKYLIHFLKETSKFQPFPRDMLFNQNHGKWLNGFC